MRPMSSEGSRSAVIAALLGNSTIAVAKFVAALFTGSAGMLAEAFHSVADTGNQLFLLRGLAVSHRGRSVEHRSEERRGGKEGRSRWSPYL